MKSEQVNQAGSIAGLVRAIAGSAGGLRILEGEVIQERPDEIKIRAENDAKLIIPESRLIIPQWLTNHKYEAHILTEMYKTGTWTCEKKDDSKYKRDPSCACPDCSITPCTEHYYKQDWIVLKNRLRAGDKVIMLELSQDERFLVLDRVRVTEPDELTEDGWKNG